jgi:hypothetical protein
MYAVLLTYDSLNVSLVVAHCTLDSRSTMTSMTAKLQMNLILAISARVNKICENDDCAIDGH